MKYIKKFRELLYLATAAIATLGWVIHQLPALSEFNYPTAPDADNLACYMETEEGQVLNLDKLCEQNTKVKRPIADLSAKDRQFIEDYKKMLKGLPKVEAARSRQVEENPEIIAIKALEVCNELRTGVYSEARIAQPDVDADIINYLAPEYYCPEFND